MADTRDIETLKRTMTDACTPGLNFDPARCSYLAQALGRVQTQYSCTSGNKAGVAAITHPGTSSWSSASAVLPSQGQILAVKGAAEKSVGDATAGALATPLSNRICSG